MKKLPLVINLTASAGLMFAAACSVDATDDGLSPDEYSEDTATNGLWRRPGLLFVDYRGLNGAADGVGVIDVDPESRSFGRFTQKQDIGAGILPHHLYFDRDAERLYTTALGGSSLYEVDFSRDLTGVPTIKGIVPINTYGNSVGEDIYFTEDRSRYYVTFMGGDGSPTGGSVGVFDTDDNSLLDVIVANKPVDASSTDPFVMYPHGISANEDVNRLMVTSTIHPDLSTGVGNSVTSIDLTTNEVTQTYLVADTASELTAPVEVFLLRDGLPPYALTTTMLGGDIWISGYNQATGEYGQFSKAIEGDNSGLSWPLEFYVRTGKRGEKELFVSFGVPGVVNVYSLDSLPRLTLKRSFSTGAGAHHMVFFRTKSGREVVAVQNNLLDLNGLNAGTITVHDVYSGKLLGTVDLRTRYNLMPESIEWAYGHGHTYHH